MRQVEVAAAEELEGPTPEDLDAIRGATFTVEAIAERERITDHDVAAFVDVLAASAGPAGRWIHFGLTSSDVLDTALGLQLRQAGEVIVAGARELVDALAERAREHRATLCVGRTHGVHAEPTTFGLKLAGFAFEAAPQRRAARARVRAGVGGRDLGRGGHVRDARPRLRGAGAAAARAAARAGLDAGRGARPPRRALQAIALAGRRHRALRHRGPPPAAHGGARGAEPFRAGQQKGSSAMPHKRNPILSERMCGLARVLRGYATGRGRERGAVARARHLALGRRARRPARLRRSCIDYMQAKTTGLVRGLVVDAERMRHNLDLTSGALFSQRVLLALVEAGMSRDEAYRVVQESAQRAFDTGTPLRELIAAAGGPAGGARPRRALRLQLVRPPRGRGHRAPRRGRRSGRACGLAVRRSLASGR